MWKVTTEFTLGEQKKINFDTHRLTRAATTQVQHCGSQYFGEYCTVLYILFRTPYASDVYLPML